VQDRSLVLVLMSSMSRSKEGPILHSAFHIIPWLRKLLKLIKVHIEKNDKVRGLLGSGSLDFCSCA